MTKNLTTIVLKRGCHEKKSCFLVPWFKKVWEPPLYRTLIPQTGTLNASFSDHLFLWLLGTCFQSTLLTLYCYFRSLEGIYCCDFALSSIKFYEIRTCLLRMFKPVWWYTWCYITQYRTQAFSVNTRWNSKDVSSLEFLVHPGVKKGCEPVNRWTPSRHVLVCPVNSIHYHNDPVVCSAGEARSGNGDDRGRQEWRKCHGKHSCCHILLWSHRETCRDLSLVNKKKAEEERERREERKEKKGTPRGCLRGEKLWERWKVI